ncbi:MAG: apolipoprotein N-acyltransferase [Pseudomonadota bacterium]
MPSPKQRSRLRHGLPLVAGAIAALGQAPIGLWPLALAGLTALFVLRPQGTWRAHALFGWLAGVGYFAVSLFWIVEPFFVDATSHGWMAPFALFFMAGGLAIFWALGFGLAQRSTALLIATWTGAEALRAFVLTGFPWAHPGHIWVDTPIAQLSALFGPHGLTLFTLGVAGLVATRKGLWIGAGSALFLAVGAFGFLRTQTPVEMRDITVRLVQPNAEQHLKWRNDMIPIFFDRMMQATLATPQVDAVIWPETAVPFLYQQRPDLDLAIAQAAQAPVVYGTRTVEDDKLYNSLAVLDREGQAVDVYHKTHLVPFGEYLPFEPLLRALGLDIFVGFRSFDAGSGLEVITAAGLPPFLPLICYEAIFPQEINAVPRAEWMLHLTNDAWFGQLTGPYQHLALAQLRAIEQGLPVARAANTGVSAMIDPLGRVTQSLGLGEAGHVDAQLPAPLAPTLYRQAGDWPIWVALIALAALGWYRARP